MLLYLAFNVENGRIYGMHRVFTMALQGSAQFTLITPSAIVPDAVTQVELHLQFNALINDENLKIIAKQGDRKWDLKEIDQLNNIVM